MDLFKICPRQPARYRPVNRVRTGNIPFYGGAQGDAAVAFQQCNGVQGNEKYCQKKQKGKAKGMIRKAS